MKIYIFTDYYNGQKIEDTITRDKSGLTAKTYINGELTSVNKIYKVNTDKPYIRSFGEKFYYTGDRLQAIKELVTVKEEA